MSDEKHIGEEVDEILEGIVIDEALPTLPLVFTGRDGETRQIGDVELQTDGTIIGRVYSGAEGALPALFSMPLAFHVDGSLHFLKDNDAAASKKD